jgi:hypothetical protein
MIKILHYFVPILFVLSAGNIYAQVVPSPKEHFGFSIGDDYQLATYTQTEDYFKKLAASTDRLKLVDIGKTEEGRIQYMLIISSPENIKNLEKYKSISQRLALVEGLNDTEAKALAAEGKSVVWIDGGLHANEVVGTHQLIETAYSLVSRTDAETNKILDKVIILMTHANPDGQEIVSNWYMRDADVKKRSTAALPRPYNKYIGHDNNRDFFMLNMKETQNMGRQLFIEWLPQIMYNHHQAGPAGTVVAGPPYRDPFNYVFDPVLMTSLDGVGAAMHNRLNAEGKPGYTQRNGSVFSTWYNGGLRTTTYFHNMVGLLTEIIGNPTPMNIPLVPSRLLPNSDSPNPVKPQEWHFRQSIDYSLSLNFAVLGHAMRYSDELLYNIYLMGKSSIERGSKDHWTMSPKRVDGINESFSKDKANATLKLEQQRTLPVKYYDTVMHDPKLRDARAYILSAAQPDFPTAIKFLNALIRTGIVVQKATAAFTVKGKRYPKGSYVVKTNQAFRPHILDMFEPQDHPNDFKYPGGPPIAPYDAAGWTLAYLMNVKFDRLLEDFEAQLERMPYGEVQTAENGSLKSASGYLITAAVNDAYTMVNDLLRDGVDVFRNQDNGDFYVPGNAKSKLEKAAVKTGLTVSASSSKPKNLVKVNATKIALFDMYGGMMPSGWIRWMMEQYHFNATVIYPQDIDKGGLNDKFDVIIFPDGGISALAAGNMPMRGGNIKPEEVPEMYRNRIGRISADKSIPQLKQFLDAGGRIVAIGSSTNVVYHLNLPVRDAMVELSPEGKERRLPDEKYYVPGSVLRVNYDRSKSANWGMEESGDIYFDNSPVFRITAAAVSSGRVKPLAWFGTATPLRSGWAWGQAYLQDGVVAFEAAVGKGKLVAFGPEITFRAQTHGTFKLLFNQLYSQK